MEALQAMGAKIETNEVTMPQSMFYIWDIHRDIRFSRIPDSDSFILVPREPVTIISLMQYLNLSGLTLNKYECNLIMSIDSIFERYLSAHV